MDEWMSTQSASKIIGLTQHRISELANKGTIVSRRKHGGTWWEVFVTESEGAHELVYVQNKNDTGAKIGEEISQDQNPAENDLHSFTMTQKELWEHICNIRAIAKRLMSELHLPEIEYLFEKDFGAPGIHRFYKGHGIGAPSINRIKQSQGVGEPGMSSLGNLLIRKRRDAALALKVVSNEEIQLLFPVDFDLGVERLLGDLKLHLLRGEYIKLLKGIDQLRRKGGEIVKFCQQLLIKIIEDLRDNMGVKFGDQNNGYSIIHTRFADVIGANAIRLARGSLPTLKLEYSRVDFGQKHYGFYSGNFHIAYLYKNELNRYEKIHRQLSEKCSRWSITQNIINLMRELEETDSNIAGGLEKFTRAIPLPGYCDVCEKARGLLLSVDLNR